MMDGRCVNCRYLDAPGYLSDGNGLCRRRDPHPEYGFPVIRESLDETWCGEWMPVNPEPIAFAVPPRDNFLELVDRWTKYVDACHRSDNTPMSLDEFRQAEMNWDLQTGAANA